MDEFQSIDPKFLVKSVSNLTFDRNYTNEVFVCRKVGKRNAQNFTHATKGLSILYEGLM